MTGPDLKTKRMMAGISGRAVCQLAGISRAKLSDIERGYALATPEDRCRIEAAIDQILKTKQYLATVAAEAGLTLTGIGL